MITQLAEITGSLHAAFGCLAAAIGVGLVGAKAVEGVGRNPGASGLSYADEMKAKLAAAQEESAASAKRAQVEASRIIDEARKSAKDFLDKQTQETAAKASDLLAKAQQAIELEKKKMLAEARTEIARLVVVTTERVLAKKLTDADRSAYNDAASRELTNA